MTRHGETIANVVLTGFMATGKSTVGRLLAERLDREFVDTDVLIEAEHGPIPVIFAQRGEDHFRRLEHQVANQLSQRCGLVISTGGRMLLDPENARVLAASGDVFCLTATADEIFARVTAQQAEIGLKRPMLGDDPAGRIKVLLAERADGYGRFRQVPTTGRPSEQIVDDLVELLSTKTPISQGPEDISEES